MLRLTGKSAEELAAIERDEQLVMAGRQAVGSATISDDRASRSKPSPASSAPDELDDLVDELNDERFGFVALKISAFKRSQYKPEARASESGLIEERNVKKQRSVKSVHSLALRACIA